MKIKGEFPGSKKEKISMKYFGAKYQVIKTTPHVKYQCPMKCNGEEVYDEPGICPDSKMHVIPVGGGYIFY